MRLGGALLLVCLGALHACGGRTFDAGDAANGGSGPGKVGPGAGSSKAGAPGAGTKPPGNPGNPGTGTPIGVGGTSGAVPPTGGASTGGSSTCGPCMQIGCTTGYVLAPPKPGDCCSSECVLDCRDEGCSDIDLGCREGFHVGTLADECCPRCLPDMPLPCEVAIQRYERLRTELIAKYQGLGCSSRGCVVFGESNRCRSTCGTPIPYEARDLIEEDLGNFAADWCGECPRELPQPCPAPANVGCNLDQCTYIVDPQ
jgi:hypothetical protein